MYSTIPSTTLLKKKNILRSLYDFILSPLRLVILPDNASEAMRLTSLRAERFSKILPLLQGKVLDIGAGDNALLRCYKRTNQSQLANESVGVDVVDWGYDCTIVEDSAKLPFDDNNFDTVVFLACINHIPNRIDVLREARRVLKKDGVLIITMINRFIGELGHKIWWYSEDKHRHVDEDELMGMDKREVVELIQNSGFQPPAIYPFVYGLNRVYIAKMA